jgi:hypothetical protein
MMKPGLAGVAIILGLFIGLPATAQTPENTEPKAEEKAALKKKGIALLEQVTAESGELKLPENRIHMQIAMGDMLWPHNEGRARAMFEAAAAALIELRKRAPAGRRDRHSDYEGDPLPVQLRQQLILTVAKHNAPLAYQILQATRVPATPINSSFNPRAAIEEGLEQNLLMQIVETDPQLALKNAEALLDKGQYPYSLMQIITTLQSKDKEAAARLTDKLVKQLQGENLLAKPQAIYLAIMLLQSGPRLSETPAAPASDNPKPPMVFPGGTGGGTPWLSETPYRGLLETVVTIALKGSSASASTTPNLAAIEGASAMNSLMANLQSLVPQIEKYLPAKLAAVRQKMKKVVVTGYQPSKEVTDLLQRGTSESLLAAAPLAPEYMQAMVYNQAAAQAIEEGNTERAQQIINEHIDPSMRGDLLKMIESHRFSEKSSDITMEGIRKSLARLSDDEERFDFLLERAEQVADNNKKLALQILEEAQHLIGPRANSYEDLGQQLELAEAYVDLDAARSFEILDAGIARLNELFPAARALNGFDVDLFKDGEMLLNGGGALADKVNEFAEHLGALAAKDFDRAVAFAEKFQLSEARILVRLNIAKALLDEDAEPPAKTGNQQMGNTLRLRH